MGEKRFANEAGLALPCTCMFMGPEIKTHGSESRGQEEAGLRDEPVSYLQVAPL